MFHDSSFAAMIIAGHIQKSACATEQKCGLLWVIFLLTARWTGGSGMSLLAILGVVLIVLVVLAILR
jgi:hypothetical protein